jgi:short-subunit dehydrogenase involved in D-alanine esterification of teichoic acids
LAKTQKVNVIISGRNEIEGQKIVEQMHKISPKLHHEFIPCDCFMMSNIRTFCNENFISKNRKVDFLVLSQGMATIASRTETSEGIDKKLALHYYGRMQFIKCLLPHNKSNTRVLSVLSAGVHSAYVNEGDP